MWSSGKTCPPQRLPQKVCRGGPTVWPSSIFQKYFEYVVWKLENFNKMPVTNDINQKVGSCC